MGRQNVYDDADFFAGYAELRRSGTGLHENVIRPHLPSLLPDLAGKRLVDLGCGDGWLCRLARERGAATAIGIEPSERMLAVAADRTADPAISYVRSFAEDAELPAGSADVVVSILALHYVAELDRVLTSVASWLADEGVFVAIVEHPIATSQQPKTGFVAEDGVPVFWPLAHYFDEGERRERWYVDGVLKYHRRLETYVDAVLGAGLELERLTEPVPTDEVLERRPWSREDLIRPSILGLRAGKRARPR